MGVVPSYKLVKIGCKQDNRQEIKVENKFSNNFKGHKAVVIGVILQRQLVHDGKKPLTASPWLTLTGSSETPVWEDLENPATTKYILRPDLMKIQRRVVRNQMGPPAQGQYDELVPVPSPVGKGKKGKKKEFKFSYEDTEVDPFKTYQYRFALIAGIQEGIRLFRKPVTPEDLAKDKNAVYKFDPELYDLGEDFTKNEVFEQDELKKYGFTTTVGISPAPEKAGIGAVEMTASSYYKIISKFSNVFKATVETDCEIILSGQMADQVSIYILKHFRYTIEQKAGGAQPGPAEGPFTGELEREARPQQGIKKTLWADLLTSSLHSIKDRIRRKGMLVSGSEFADRKPRRVDFDTPYELLKVGHADYKEVVMVPVREMNEDGELEEKLEARERIIRDLLYIEVRNIFTQVLQT